MSFIKNKNEVYVIAEIGQNHNGDINIAKKLIDQLVVYPYDEITGNRLNCVNGIKLCKRDMIEELSNKAYKKPYINNNSFGKTYGEHRKFLELSYNDHYKLGNYIKEKNVEFIDTLCSIKTVQQLAKHVDKIKVASRDLTNIPLLKEIAKHKKDVILSTGLGGEEELNNALDVLIAGKTNQIIILHCLSQYPSEYKNINLKSIE
jgi:sialic acid synthase